MIRLKAKSSLELCSWSVEEVDATGTVAPSAP